MKIIDNIDYLIGKTIVSISKGENSFILFLNDDSYFLTYSKNDLHCGEDIKLFKN